jgi:hypothetical protein
VQKRMRSVRKLVGHIAAKECLRKNHDEGDAQIPENSAIWMNGRNS